MQFSYVVTYDSDKDKWFVDDYMTNNMDGNVWDDDLGLFFADDAHAPMSEGIDRKCYQMLQSLVTIWPSPLVNGEL